LRSLSSVIVVSAAEAAAFHSVTGSSRAAIISNGVVQRHSESWKPPATHQVLYTGSITYAPNLEAVEFFVSDILPWLKVEAPAAFLTVTGALPPVIPDTVLVPEVRFTGLLNDLDEIYRASRVFIAPILSGAGTRVKILEAMALGLPVVSTSIGAEGLGIIPGQHAVVEDDAKEFARAVACLLTDSSTAEALGAAGRAYVEQHYDWSVIGQRLLRLVHETIDQHAVVA
jgi:glycosyltransferase involved in cell wall biosynthesis